MFIQIKGYTRKDGTRVRGYRMKRKPGQPPKSRVRPVKSSQRYGQVGRTNLKADGKRRAGPPGRRISRRGRVYTETRRNRSDVNASRRGPWV